MKVQADAEREDSREFGLCLTDALIPVVDDGTRADISPLFHVLICVFTTLDVLAEGTVESGRQVVEDFQNTVGLIPNLTHLFGASFDILVVLLVDITGRLYEVFGIRVTAEEADSIERIVILLADACFSIEDQAALVSMFQCIICEPVTAVISGSHVLWIPDGKYTVRVDN